MTVDGVGEGNFRSSELAGINSYTYQGRVIQRLRSMGLGEPPRPVYTEKLLLIYPEATKGQPFDGRLPSTLRRLTLDQISDLHTTFSNWYAYISYQAKLIEAQRSEAQRQREFMWSTLRTMLRNDKATGEKRNDQQCSDAATIDVRFIKYDALFAELDAVNNLLDAFIKTASKDLSNISREVTIRTTEIEHGSRNRGFNNRTRYALQQEGEENLAPNSFDEAPSANPPQKATGGRLLDWRKASTANQS